MRNILKYLTLLISVLVLFSCEEDFAITEVGPSDSDTTLTDSELPFADSIYFTNYKWTYKGGSDGPKSDEIDNNEASEDEYAAKVAIEKDSIGNIQISVDYRDNSDPRSPIEFRHYVEELIKGYYECYNNESIKNEMDISLDISNIDELKNDFSFILCSPDSHGEDLLRLYNKDNKE